MIAHARLALICLLSPLRLYTFFFFFFNDPAPTEIYTLSLHDALPISARSAARFALRFIFTSKLRMPGGKTTPPPLMRRDRKSTRLNSSHMSISYAVFCLKKKKKKNQDPNKLSMV